MATAKKKATAVSLVSTMPGARPMVGVQEYVGLERRTRVVLVKGDPADERKVVTIDYKLGEDWIPAHALGAGVHHIHLCPLPFRMVAPEGVSFAMD